MPVQNTSTGATRTTASSKLLSDALVELDTDALIRATKVPLARLQRWAMPTHKMTIEQKGVVAFAIIALAPPASPLLRRAAALRGQVCAAIEYELGVTTTGNEPPRTRL